MCALPLIIADWETSLAAKIAVGGTTGTLIGNTDDDGVTIGNGTVYLTIDGNNSAKEHIKCTKTGTALSDIYSVSRQGVETSGVVREHRVGAKVIMTDYATYKNYFEAAVGDVDGPSSSTDNAIARFDSITGKLLQDSLITVTDDSGLGVFITTPIKSGNGTVLYYNAGNADGGVGGNNYFQGGSATSGNQNGGSGITRGGEGFGSGTGGAGQLLGGAAGATGAGGAAIVQGGAGGATSGDGGNSALWGGDATNGDSNGGNLDFRPGRGHGSGTDGIIGFKKNNDPANPSMIFDLSQIASSNKTFTFLNSSGALTTSTSGAGVPTGTAPAAIGLMYIDTSAGKVYVSTGVSAGSDWKILN